MVAVALNPDCRKDVRIVGDEETPVVVLDDALVSVDELRDYACREVDFGPDGQFAYPGIRAELPDTYVEALAPPLAALLAQLFNVPRGLRYQLIHRVFSLITTKPEDLSVLQRIPHTDTQHAYYFATVHYLAPGPHAGTGFFRHRPTGFERISEARYPSLREKGMHHMQTRGMPDPKYINASDDHFELIAEVEHRPNRLVAYPGNLLHSGLIRPDIDINPDPLAGRLTANLFFYFAADAV